MRLAEPCPETGQFVDWWLRCRKTVVKERRKGFDSLITLGSSGSNGTCVCLTHTTHRWHLLCRLSSRSVFRLAGHTLLVSNRVGSQSG
jgi:hypothetical protein